jgi:hypothetical protein
MVQYVDRIIKYLSTEFEKELCVASFENLNGTSKLRFNNFAYSLRELTRNVLHRLAPSEEVLNCRWYTNQIPEREKGITRGQRIQYAIQGGIEDQYVKNELGIDVKALNKLWKDRINILNKYTHVNEDSFDIPEEDIGKYVENTVDALTKFFESIENCKTQINDKVLEHLFSPVSNKVIQYQQKRMIETYSRMHPLTFQIERNEVESITSEYVNVIGSANGHILLTADKNPMDIPEVNVEMIEFDFHFQIENQSLREPVFSNLDFEITKTDNWVHKNR